MLWRRITLLGLALLGLVSAVAVQAGPAVPSIDPTWLNPTTLKVAWEAGETDVCLWRARPNPPDEQLSCWSSGSLVLTDTQAGDVLTLREQDGGAVIASATVGSPPASGDPVPAPELSQAWNEERTELTISWSAAADVIVLICDAAGLCGEVGRGQGGTVTISAGDGPGSAAPGHQVVLLDAREARLITAGVPPLYAAYIPGVITP